MKYLNYLTLAAIFILLPFQIPAQDYWAGFSSVKYDGKHFYAVADQLYQIVQLDKAGNVTNSLGRRGKGPKEFSTDNLELLVTDSLLYVLDGKGMALTKIDKKTFNIRGRERIKKPASSIIYYNSKLFGYVNDLEEADPVETGELVKVFRPINQLREPEASLFKIENPNPINPFYDGELMDASNNTVVIAREGKSMLTIFHGDSLYRRNIPNIEKLSLGEEIKKDTEFLEGPVMKIVWKKKIMPEYMLIRSIYVKDQYIYIQVHSYKIGEALIRYDLESDTFKNIGSLKQGTLAAVDNDTVYTLEGEEIITTSLSRLQSLADKPVTFYFSSDAFNEQCSSCTDSLFEWYDYVKRQNIPVKIILEDNSWFGTNDVNSQTVNNLLQWNIWGEISYGSKCNDCFDSSISVQIPSSDSDEKLYSFPESITTLKISSGDK